MSLRTGNQESSFNCNPKNRRSHAMRLGTLTVLATAVICLQPASLHATNIVYDFNGPASIANWTFESEEGEDPEFYRFIEINWNVTISGLGFDVPTAPPPPPSQWFNTQAVSPPFKIPDPAAFFAQFTASFQIEEPFLDQAIIEIRRGNFALPLFVYDPQDEEPEPEPGAFTVCEDGSCADAFADEGPDSIYQLWITASDFDPEGDSMKSVRFDNIILHNAVPFQASLSGDHNGDGNVDASDYVVWRKTNINGPQGYNDWRANFGASLGQAAAQPGRAVPEADSVLLVGVAAVVSIMTRSWAPMRRRGDIIIKPAISVRGGPGGFTECFTASRH
ncbi:MAG: hypothetical protein WD738_09895 [Pirellulales bacterium]